MVVILKIKNNKIATSQRFKTSQWNLAGWRSDQFLHGHLKIWIFKNPRWERQSFLKFKNGYFDLHNGSWYRNNIWQDDAQTNFKAIGVWKFEFKK